MTIESRAIFCRFPAEVVETISDFLDDPNEIVVLREVYAEMALNLQGDALRQFIEEPTYWKRYFCRMFSCVNMPSTDRLCEKVCGLATRFYGFRPAYGLTPYVPIAITRCIRSEFSARVQEMLSCGYEQCVAQSPLMSVTLRASQVPFDELIELLDVGIKEPCQHPALKAFLLHYHKELQEVPELQCHVAYLNDPELKARFLGKRPAAGAALTKAVFLDSAKALKRLAKHPPGFQFWDIDKGLRLALCLKAINVATYLIELGADLNLLDEIKMDSADEEMVVEAPEAEDLPLRETTLSIPGGKQSWTEAFHLLFSHDDSALTKPMHAYMNLVDHIYQLTHRFYKQKLSNSPFYIEIKQFKNAELYVLFREALDCGYEQFFVHNKNRLKQCTMDTSQLRKLAHYGVRLQHRHTACRAFLRVYRRALMDYELLNGVLRRVKMRGLQHWSIILNDMKLLAFSCKCQNSVDLKAVEMVVQANHVAACSLFLEKGGLSPNRQGPSNLHLLQEAALSDAVDVAALLIRKKAHVEVGKGSGVGTPLHLVSSTAMATLLLDNGADIHALNRKKQTPLHRAVKFNHPDVVKLLLERGADPMKEDGKGKRAVQYAQSADMQALFSQEEEPPAKRRRK